MGDNQNDHIRFWVGPGRERALGFPRGWAVIKCDGLIDDEITRLKGLGAVYPHLVDGNENYNTD